MSNKKRNDTLVRRREATRFCTAASLVLACLPWLAGCASLQPAPFTAFATATQELKTGTDASLTHVSERATDRYVDEAVKNVDKILSLKLAPDPKDVFGWTIPDLEPFFLKTTRFRDGVDQLNTALIGYATLLSQLADPNVIPEKTFETMTTDLNDNLTTAVASMGAKPPPTKETAIISTLAVAVFRDYLHHQQRSALIKAIRTNQEAIDTVADLGANAVTITARAITNEYASMSQGLATQAADASQPESVRKTAIRALIALDDQYEKELRILRILHDSYVALPAAHRELANGLEKPQQGLPAIRALAENGKQLYRQYKELTEKKP